MAMNRRNVLIGLGAVAAGGGAVFGSGAFSQVEANRAVTVSLAGDASALLQLEPVNTTVASTTNGTLELDLTGGASGLNYDAITEFTSVFKITNNGDSSVSVYLNQGDNAASGLLIDTTDNRFFNDADGSTSLTSADPIIEFYAGTSVPSNSSTNGIVGSGSGNLTLSSGGSSDVSVRIDTKGVDSSNVTAGNDLVQEINVHAN